MPAATDAERESLDRKFYDAAIAAIDELKLYEPFFGPGEESVIELALRIKRWKEGQ